MTDIDSTIVLPDDPGFGTEVQVDYPGYRSTRAHAAAIIVGSRATRST